jgi:hypothetical protein
VLVTLFFSKVVTVQVLSQLPQLGLDRVIFDFNAVHAGPLKAAHSFEAVASSDQHRNARNQLPINLHFIDDANADRVLKPDVCDRLLEPSNCIGV